MKQANRHTVHRPDGRAVEVVIPPKYDPAEEQRFQVDHYFRLWKTFPTADNWSRVVDAADAYAPELATVGTYRVHTDGQGRRHLMRLARIGRQGARYWQTFRKGKGTWTVAR